MNLKNTGGSGLVRGKRRAYTPKKTEPEGERFWMFRRGNWIEFWENPKRPVRAVSRILVGGKPLIRYGFKSGGYLGALPCSNGMRWLYSHNPYIYEEIAPLNQWAVAEVPKGSQLELVLRDSILRERLFD